MKVVQRRLFKRVDREALEREIEEEFRLHLDLLTQKHLQRDLSLGEAKDAALKRFGNVERIKGECVEISSSGQPLIRALKALLVPIFLTGVLTRVFSTELAFTRIGNTLMVIAVLGRLLIYVRAWKPSSFKAKPETSSPLMLREISQTSVTPYDQRRRTPVERVISND